MAESRFPLISAQWVAKALSLPSPDGDPVFSAVTTDSRKIASGCLFVALAGEKFDGHDFAVAALDRGAAAIVVRSGSQAARDARAKHPSSVVFEVPDTLSAYRELGAAWRDFFRGPVILVAGSAGKTTTKEMLTAILRGKYREVLKTQGSQNGFVGIPMTLLELNASHQAAVIEVGIDEVGAMARHAAIVRPDVSALTAIGAEHLEKLHDISTVAREEGVALESAIRSGTKIAVNLDDPHIAPFFDRAPGAQRLGYGLGASVASAADRLRGKITEDFSSLEVDSERFELPLPGRHNASNLLCAIACAKILGLTTAEMKAGLKTFSGAEGRSQLRELKGPLHVLCDYYNSQPPSVMAAIELLSQLSRAQALPRWACLGDMLELGADEERYHREIAPILGKHRIENVLLFGSRMKWLKDELAKTGFNGRVEHFETREKLASSLISQVQPPAFVLIKGSRSMKMEEVWKLLESSRK